jgi:hypothetical protein
MSHPQQMAFFQALANAYPEHFHRARVIEVGSLDLNGSVRTVFSDCQYTGYDLAPGPGVDVAEQGQLIGAPTASAQTLVSAECFEHNPFWVETFSNMLRLSAPGGFIAISCATTGRQEHGTARTNPADSPLTGAAGWGYYRNLDADDFVSTFNLPGWFGAYHFLFCPQTFDLYFYGLRKNADGHVDEARFLANADALELALQNASQTVRIGRWTAGSGWIPRLKWALP